MSVEETLAKIREEAIKDDIDREAIEKLVQELPRRSGGEQPDLSIEDEGFVTLVVVLTMCKDGFEHLLSSQILEELCGPGTPLSVKEQVAVRKRLVLRPLQEDSVDLRGLQEAIQRHVCEVNPSSRVAKAMRKVAEDILRRLEYSVQGGDFEKSLSEFRESHGKRYHVEGKEHHLSERAIQQILSVYPASELTDAMRSAIVKYDLLVETEDLEAPDRQSPSLVVPDSQPSDNSKPSLARSPTGLMGSGLPSRRGSQVSPLQPPASFIKNVMRTHLGFKEGYDTAAHPSGDLSVAKSLLFAETAAETPSPGQPVSLVHRVVVHQATRTATAPSTSKPASSGAHGEHGCGGAHGHSAGEGPAERPHGPEGQQHKRDAPVAAAGVDKRPRVMRLSCLIAMLDADPTSVSRIPEVVPKSFEKANQRAVEALRRSREKAVVTVKPQAPRSSPPRLLLPVFDDLSPQGSDDEVEIVSHNDRLPGVLEAMEEMRDAICTSVAEAILEGSSSHSRVTKTVRFRSDDDCNLK